MTREDYELRVKQCNSAWEHATVCEEYIASLETLHEDYKMQKSNLEKRLSLCSQRYDSLKEDYNTLMVEVTPKTCKTCMYFNLASSNGNEFEGTCDNNVCMDYELLGDMVSDTFYCNEYEAKSDQ